MTDAPVIGPVVPPELHVMSYNIRRRMPHLSRRSPDRWEHRKPLLARLLSSELPTILGTQEALPDQENFVLSSLPDHYRSIGFGRRPGKDGERCPIFYDTQRVRLIEWAQAALSDTPTVPGSTGWGNWTPRIIVSATFEDTATGSQFLAVNTHFDHLSRKARLRSAEAVRQLISASKLPAIVTGDFNTDVESRPYDAMTSDGQLRDCWVAADHRLTEAWGTFPNYRRPRHERKRIDWILSTPQFDVMRAAINVTRFDGDWASDHAPVQAVVRLREAASESGSDTVVI